MSTPDNNVHRQVFGLSLVANCIREIKGPEDKLQGLAEKAIPELLHERLPGWEVVWGPRVWKKKPESTDSGPDHVFFVARNPNLAYSNGEQKDTYVVAIAATATPYNWIQNNARVNKVVDLYKWLREGISTDPTPLAGAGWTPGSCYIALGTALGVWKLASLESPKTATHPGVTLPAYLASFPQSSNTRVVLTGHSLGGALSPTLALGLLESGGFAKFDRANVLVYPTAGPTAGNRVFAKLFSDRFPKIPGPGYQVWDCNIINHLDVVSHAWCTSEHVSPEQNLYKVPTLYGDPIKDVKRGVDAGIFLASLSLVIYKPLPAARFKGTPPTDKPTTLDDFLTVAGEQHMDEFYKLFDVTIPKSKLLIGEDGLEMMTRIEVARTEPILSEIVGQFEAERRLQKEISDDDVSFQALSEDFTP